MSSYLTVSDRPLRLLGVFAHPDDEVFCVGGTLAQWTEAGNEAMIVSATRGQAGQIQDVRVATRQTLGAVREQELRAGCAELGVERVACLDYTDGALAEVDAAQLAADVAVFIRDYQPDVVVTFGLDGGSGHPDHIAISVATTLACQLVARQDGWAPRLYYSAFPRQHGLLCHSLARWLATRGERVHGSDAFVQGLALVADEAALMGYVDDDVRAQWFSSGFAIVEQGERNGSLYLIVSGHAQVVAESEQGARRVLRTLGPGQFFGAEELAWQCAHAATVVATDTVTCLTLSAQAPTAFDGRGAVARDGVSQGEAARDGDAALSDLLCLDVSGGLERKVAALAAHRSQFAITPELLALAPIWQVMSSEYFEPVIFGALPAAAHSAEVRRASDALRLGAQAERLAVSA
ncbi:MAG TPA: PIG-L family deacetylase [Ktedonobacterales bacterium]|nr:PIG-L family deacetylase [Ktedonobacterales bacterium]